MRFPAIVIILALSACARAQARAVSPVKTGIDVLEEDGFKELRGKRVGLITNQTGKDRSGRSTVDILARAPGVTLSALFSAEHGFYGASEDLAVGSSTVVLNGRAVVIHSLYSGGIGGMRPRPEDLKDLDALVFDIQDIGARFYTYLATMGMALEESSKAGIEFVVLDRPNPINGVAIEGPILEDLSLRELTPTAYFPVPIRHGMTAGEIALLHNAEVKSTKLTVVRMSGWSREMWFDQTGLPWTPPSPNMPDLDAATLYPGIAIFEASNLAVGRGTPVPFRWIGAPWLDAKAVLDLVNTANLEGVEFSEQDYTPAKSVYAGTLCRGLRLRITDRARLRPLDVFLRLNLALRQVHPREFQWRWDEAKRMTGTDAFRKLYESGAALGEFEKLFDSGAQNFASSRKLYLLY